MSALMKHARLVALALLVLITAAGCNYGDGLTDIGPSVGGQILDAATNAPVAGATISIAGRMAESAFNGVYYVPDVPRGTHMMKVTKSGYAEATVEVKVDGSVANKTVLLTK